MNDVPFAKPGHDIYYIITRYPKSTSISVRTNGTVDLTEYLPMVEAHPSVKSAGGHPQAGGINFHGQPGDSVILNVIDAFHNHINAAHAQEHDFTDDLPF